MLTAWDCYIRARSALWNAETMDAVVLERLVRERV